MSKKKKKKRKSASSSEIKLNILYFISKLVEKTHKTVWTPAFTVCLEFVSAAHKWTKWRTVHKMTLQVLIINKSFVFHEGVWVREAALRVCCLWLIFPIRKMDYWGTNTDCTGISCLQQLHILTCWRHVCSLSCKRLPITHVSGVGGRREQPKLGTLHCGSAAEGAAGSPQGREVG